MSEAIANLTKAMEQGMQLRPQAGGFPYLAETLRLAGVTRNIWSLPSCQSLFLTQSGAVVMPGQSLVSGIADVPTFNQENLIRALRRDQAGESTFPEFLQAAWSAGVVRYEVDFEARTVLYQGCHGEAYLEAYPMAAVAPLLL